MLILPQFFGRVGQAGGGEPSGTTFEDHFTSPANQRLDDRDGWDVAIQGRRIAFIDPSGLGLSSANETFELDQLETLYMPTIQPDGDGPAYFEVDWIGRNISLNFGYAFLGYVDETNFVGLRFAGIGGVGTRAGNVVNGSFSPLIQWQSFDGDTIRLELEGATLRVYQNGTQQGSTTVDAKFDGATGVGIQIESSTNKGPFFSRWKSGNL